MSDLNDKLYGQMGIGRELLEIERAMRMFDYPPLSAAARNRLKKIPSLTAKRFFHGQTEKMPIGIVLRQQRPQTLADLMFATYGWRGMVGSMGGPVVEPEPTTPIPIEHSATVLEAWRAFRLVRISATIAFLKSTNVEAIWPPGEPMSVIPVNAPKARREELAKEFDEDSDNGVYCFRSRELLMAQEATLNDVLAYGTVEIGGDIYQHRFGYRAEIAYPKHIWIYARKINHYYGAGEAEDLGACIRRLYGCEVSFDQTPCCERHAKEPNGD